MCMPFVWLLPVALIIATAIAAELFGHPIETPAPSAGIDPLSGSPSPTVLAATITTDPTPTSSETPAPISTPAPIVTGTPTTTLTATPKPTFTLFPSATAPAEALAKEDPSISFVDLPNTLSAGTKTKITIKIDGPAGTKGDNVKIKVKYHASEERNGSKSSMKSDISNSFGGFTAPATFSMDLSLGQEQASIELTATAEVNGKTIETTRTVTLN